MLVCAVLLCIIYVAYFLFIFWRGGGGAHFSHNLLDYVGAVVCLLFASSVLVLFCSQLYMFILGVRISMKFLE